MGRVLIACFSLLAACAGPGDRVELSQLQPGWDAQVSGSRASLRGVSAIDATTCWASGSDGTVLRTVNGGRSWQSVGVPEAESLDFRDIHAIDRDRALVLSAGLPAKIYRTEDGGTTWSECYSNQDEGVFFDAFDFWDEKRGVAFSDPVAGHLLIIVTRDGGQRWQPVDRDDCLHA